MCHDVSGNWGGLSSWSVLSYICTSVPHTNSEINYKTVAKTIFIIEIIKQKCIQLSMTLVQGTTEVSLNLQNICKTTIILKRALIQLLRM